MARQRLTINSHTDCIILMNAIREHCQGQADVYQSYFSKALESGDNEKADNCLRWRDEVTNCKNRTLGRLDKIRRKFEDSMEEHEGTGAGGGTSQGYSLDNATCYN